MAETEIRLRNINQLISETFYVPFYQRGYRWTETQVVALLQDIYEFNKTAEKDEIYCLQPVVVMLNDTRKAWELIDGQQRLTTIYLILNYLKRKTYNLTFTSRASVPDYCEGIINKSNIDFYHMTKAYEYIHKWFLEQHNNDEGTIFDEFFITLGKKVNIIWYEVKPEPGRSENEIRSDAIDIFTRLNIGKIPLTNAELIRALFLRKPEKVQQTEEQRLFKLQIASEWDIIENKLRNDEFWYFLNGGIKLSTRIQFIFDLMVQKHNSTLNTNNEFHSFEFFFKLLEDPLEAFPLWQKVKQLFMLLEEWYLDKDFYHLIGYLVADGKQNEIQDLIKESSNIKKSKLKDKIKEKIVQKVNFQFGELEYGKHSNQIRSLLLLFNVETIRQNGEPTGRFPFYLFKEGQWDLEHINAVNEDPPKKHEHIKQWLNDAEQVLRQQPEKNIEIEGLISEIQGFFSQESNDTANEKFPTLYEKITKILIAKNEFEENGVIGNLTILNAEINRSYKNAFFPIKRSEISRYNREGKYIPLCTRNVFLKQYSSDIKQMYYWDNSDKEEYMRSIIHVLRIFLPKQN